MTKKEKNFYLSEVQKNIHCNKNEKKQLICFLEKSIDLLLEEKRELNFEDLVAELGEPQKVAAELESTIPENEQRRFIKKTINIKRIIIATLLIIVFMFVAWFTAMFLDAHKDNNGYFEETVEIVTREIDKDKEILI